MSTVSKFAVATISLFVLLLALLLGIYAVSAWAAPGTIAPFSSLMLTLLAAVCLITVVYLNRGSLWAWWSALVVSAMVLAFGAFCIFCAYYPRTIFEQSERSFLLIAGLVFGVPAALVGVLLNIPPVRRGFQH